MVRIFACLFHKHTVKFLLQNNVRNDAFCSHLIYPKRGGKNEEESGMVTGPVEKTTLGDIEELAALKEKLSGK